MDMKCIFEGNANKGGVYQITNKINKKTYIGSAKCFKKRAYQHRSALRNGKHHNKHLQRAFNKYGKEAFEFRVLQVTEGNRDSRLKEEQKYLNNFLLEDRWNLCYNLLKQSNCGNGFIENIGKIPWNKGKTNIYSEETLLKISNSVKTSGNPNWGKARSQETKEKIAKKNKGEKNGMYGKIGKKHPRAKSYNLLSPEGKNFKGIGLRNFCNEHGLDQRSMWRVISGQRNHYKGWRKCN